MADSTSFNPEVMQASKPQQAALKIPSPGARAGQFAMWLSLALLGVGAIVPMASQFKQETLTMSLLAASDGEVINVLATDWSGQASPDYLETLAELSLTLPKPDLGSAEAAARQAVAADPSRAHVWARLAWIETQKTDGKVNPAALDALSRSMDACPLCDQELIAWRFNFVLANWNAVPDPLRRRAFEHADLLRWIGPNAEFLAEMRVKARQNGIPFDAYRAAVNTPVRTWDISAETVRPRA